MTLFWMGYFLGVIATASMTYFIIYKELSQ